MKIFYLDSSAWVKYYVGEPGSLWVEKFWNLHGAMACADLALIEVLATLARRHKDRPSLRGSFDQTIRDVQNQFLSFTPVALDSTVLLSAARIALTRGLRGADSVHLASAIRLRDILSATVTFIASDVELLAAAAAEGFAVLDPSTDPAMPTVV